MILFKKVKLIFIKKLRPTKNSFYFSFQTLFCTDEYPINRTAWYITLKRYNLSRTEINVFLPQLRNYQIIQNSSSLLPWWGRDLFNLYWLCRAVNAAHSPNKNSNLSNKHSNGLTPERFGWRRRLKLPWVLCINPLDTSNQDRTSRTSRKRICFPRKPQPGWGQLGSVTPQRPGKANAWPPCGKYLVHGGSKKVLAHLTFYRYRASVRSSMVDAIAKKNFQCLRKHFNLYNF